MTLKRVTASYARGLPAVAHPRRAVRPTGGRPAQAQTTPPLAEKLIAAKVEAKAKTRAEASAEWEIRATAEASPTLQQVADFSNFRAHEVPPGERIATVDYHAIIAHAVAGLTNNTVEARHAVYECARQVVYRRLDAMRPALPAELIRLEQLSLEAVITKIEADEHAKYAAATPQPAAQQAAPQALAPVVVVPPKRGLPQAQHFQGGIIRLFSVAAVIIAGLIGYWLLTGKPELPSPRSLTQLLPAGQGEILQGTDAPAASNALTQPDTDTTQQPPGQPRPQAETPGPAPTLRATGATATGASETAATTTPTEPAAVPARAATSADPNAPMSACTDTTNANERVRCADAAIASGEGLSSADDAVSQLPYWMTFPRRVAGDARVAGAPVAARPEPAEQAARHPTASERPQNSPLEAGRALASADDMQGAIREFGEAIRLEPQLAAAYFERGQVLFKNGNSEGAIADFETATRIDPQQAMAFKALGMAVHYRGDSDRAIANLTRAIQIAQADPLRMSAIDLFFARRTRASLYNRMRHFDGELSDLGAMIDAYWKNPALASALRANYGEAGAAGVMAQVYRSRTANLVARRNFDAATADLSMAMHLDPRQTLALTIERGRVQEMAGRSAQAEADFKRALELSPNNDDVKSALSRLRSKS